MKNTWAARRKVRISLDASKNYLLAWPSGLSWEIVVTFLFHGVGFNPSGGIIFSVGVIVITEPDRNKQVSAFTIAHWRSLFRRADQKQTDVGNILTPQFTILHVKRYRVNKILHYEFYGIQHRTTTIVFHILCRNKNDLVLVSKVLKNTPHESSLMT